MYQFNIKAHHSVTPLGFLIYIKNVIVKEATSLIFLKLCEKNLFCYKTKLCKNRNVIIYYSKLANPENK